MHDLPGTAAPVSPLDWPDPLRLAAGERITESHQWPARRQELMQQMLPLAYGCFPVRPAATRLQCLHSALLRRHGGARALSCRVEPEAMTPFHLRLTVPPGLGPFAVIVTGDACWRYADDSALAAILAHGVALAEFNRVEIAPDPGGPPSGLLLPQAAAQPATLAAWAWAYHRVVDVLQSLAWIDPAAITVVGHSRGGKAALLAGATDERISLTSANNSGAGGAASWRWRGPGAETLADLLQAFPHWLGEDMRAYLGRESELPFDQHCLLAMVAPRALLTTEALDDLWANPQGSWQAHRAARCVFELLGVPDRQAIVFRTGGHDHTLADWTCLLEFAAALRAGDTRRAMPTADPYPGLPLPGRWMAGAGG